MVATLKELLHSSLSTASRKSYQRSWTVFTEFYHRFHTTTISLPVPPSCLALFISYLCAKGLAPATINSYMSAIAYIHKLKGMVDPTKSFLIEKLLVAVGRRGKSDTRLPLSRPLIYELVEALKHTNQSAYQRGLYKAMFLVAFYGFFRVGELAHKQSKEAHRVLQFEQITFMRRDNEIYSLQIVITHFKHNPSHRPFTVIIDREPTERHCPIQALIEYIKLRGNSKGPLFCYANNESISVSQFNAQLRRALSFCGLDSSRYKSHSFRIGAACYAAEKGFSDAKIRALGRWSSDAFKVYIRPPSLNANH